MGEDPIFECAEVRVPLCHQSVCESDEEINIFVKRLKGATHSDKAVWFFQGGPGGSSVAMESIMLQYDSHFNKSVDLYTLDHRGTGRSHFLQCDAAQAFNAGSPDGPTVSLEELPNCIKDINFQIDNHREAFSVTSAAWDIVEIVEELNPDKDVYLYGMSYGTYLLERVMQLGPPQVRGYIQDGVLTATTKKDGVEAAFSHRNEQMQLPSRRLLQYCYDDPECPLLLNSRETVMKDLLAIYKRVDEEKDSNQCAQLISKIFNKERPSDALRSLVEFAKDVTLREYIPLMIASVASCTKEAHHLMQQMATQFSPPHGSPEVVLDPINTISPMLYSVIVFSELWGKRSPTLEEMNDFYYSSVFASNVTSLLTHFCVAKQGKDAACDAFGSSLPKSEPFVYDRDDYSVDDITLPPNTSLVLVNGGLDFLTVQEIGEVAFKKYKGGKGRIMLNFDYGAHCMGEATAANQTTVCRDSMISSFVNNDGDVVKMDTSCMSELAPLRFKTIHEVMKPLTQGEQQHLAEPGDELMRTMT